ncbi:aldehyde oxygenase (deformylating) [Synechococcus sp. PCC 7336]|uniref:aldehyde oxygenase (deformylating) n=1 Tax=Synechococcus sp. PCC 7336 TaxID=195250 RepID=UPI000345AAAD|nr:aldehyde oxygenase (deformylating) [Synechococcus sp. PCC 7336]
MAQLQQTAAPTAAVTAELELLPSLDYQSEGYKDAYSRINAMVIEGELEANRNYLKLAELLPDEASELQKLAKMELRHMKGFQACGRNLDVTPDKAFAVEYFSQLRQNFEIAAAAGDVVTCLVIQALLIECFAIAAYNIYIPVADDFARKITEGVIADEYLHLNFGQVWLQAHFDDPDVKARVERANAENLPIVWSMFTQVTSDADALGMDPDAIIEDFMIAYGEALGEIGFSNRETMKLAAQGLKAA